jgi:hypothetical protein
MRPAKFGWPKIRQKQVQASPNRLAIEGFDWELPSIAQ